MKRFILIIMAGLLMSSSAFGWGREGHEIIAKIADNNLKPSARKVIEKYLGDHSIVYYAKWMDDYRHTPEYRFTNMWHVARVDENLKYSPYPEEGDAIFGIKQAVELLKDYKNLPDSTVAVNIKYLLHLVGDMHCPAHIYYLGRNQKIHTVWDEAAIQAVRIWSLSEWVEELDRKSCKEIKAIADGKVGAVGTTFTAENGTTYEVMTGDTAEVQIIVGPPFAFTGENIAEWAEVY